ncbi:MAG TPA: hypothetical protein VIK83_04405, partial [Coriobacteriia bacterium]
DTVVVEFPQEAGVFKSLAEGPEVTALLRESIASVLGWHVGIRYQLGRGEIRPDTEFEETETEVSYAPPVPAKTAAPVDHSAFDRALTEGLGAEVVGESGTNNGEGAT